MAHTYVLDANVFIEAARRYYAFDLAPTFWQSLVKHAAAERVCSIDRVKQELLRGKDELAEWVQSELGAAFDTTAQDAVIEEYRQIMTWAQQQTQFTGPAKAEFAKVADGWLVAYAKAHGCTLVTHEQFQPEARKRIHIPNVCGAFNVPTMDTFAMMRALGVKLG